MSSTECGERPMPSRGNEKCCALRAPRGRVAMATFALILTEVGCSGLLAWLPVAREVI
jgi:hypothetical protein